MSKQRFKNLVNLLFVVQALSSCAPKYLAAPTIQYPITQNTCTFGVQNMDENAKVEPNALTCHYDGFDVVYKVLDNLVVSLEIVNNTNKSLIIDKSKCYVLYGGYSTQLFKDVRSSRSTTFNNVQDAINNVQTNESGVSMTIPPYSKWELPIPETNVREIKKLPQFSDSPGIHSLTRHDNQETVEYVIPYTFDYSLAKWNTSRNLVYINSIDVKNGFSLSPKVSEEFKWLASNQYMITRRNGEADYSEAERIDAINMKKYKKHEKLNLVMAGMLLPVTCFTSVIIMIQGPCYNPHHLPPVYSKTNRR